MARYKSEMPMWLKVILYTIMIVFTIGALFCLTVLIYGGFTGMNFVEVLQNWSTPEKIQEAVEKTEEILSMIGII